MTLEKDRKQLISFSFCFICILDEIWLETFEGKKNRSDRADF